MSCCVCCRFALDRQNDNVHTTNMLTTPTAPFGYIIDSRTGDQIRPATSQEWSNHAQGRHDDPGHFHIRGEGQLRVMRLVFCDGPSTRTPAIVSALVAELSATERERFDRHVRAAMGLGDVTEEQARDLALFEVISSRA
jgi:hypothetical protein